MNGDTRILQRIIQSIKVLHVCFSTQMPRFLVDVFGIHPFTILCSPCCELETK